MSPETTSSSALAQATAAWIDYLHQIRVDRCLSSIHAQEVNLDHALKQLDWIRSITADILDSNRGGEKGLHGFIAEVVDTGIRNSRAVIDGFPEAATWINNNGPADQVREQVQIQQKFSQAGGLFSLDAARRHLLKYPDFLRDGGRYQIPSDHYDAVSRLLHMDEHEASVTLSGDDGLTMRQWRSVRAFFTTSGMSFDNFEPSVAAYDDVQTHALDHTLTSEEASIRQTHDERLRSIKADHTLSTPKAVAEVAIAATAEATLTAALVIVRKMQGGTRLSDFSAEDWKDVAAASGSRLVTSTIRTSSISTLTNTLNTPATAANALATTGIGIVEQAHRLRSNEISEIEFLEEVQLLAVHAAITAMGAALGQAAIPIPVLGAVIGNMVASTLTQTAHNRLRASEQALIDQIIEQQSTDPADLADDDAALVNHLTVDLTAFLELIALSSAADPTAAFEASARLAHTAGVDPDLILDSPEKRDAYFLT